MNTFLKNGVSKLYQYYLEIGKEYKDGKVPIYLIIEKLKESGIYQMDIDNLFYHLYLYDRELGYSVIFFMDNKQDKKKLYRPWGLDFNYYYIKIKEVLDEFKGICNF